MNILGLHKKRKEKTQDSISESGAFDSSFSDNRSETSNQRKQQAVLNGSPQVDKGNQFQSIINNSSQVVAQKKSVDVITQGTVQKNENKTGMPDDLKSGIENLSGISMGDVKVNYNSSQPAAMNAHAFAQGNQIHIAQGQEKHLPHEAWHLVQQRQGRVKPTMESEGVPVNDDKGLENEADVMGAKAMQMKADGSKSISNKTSSANVVQKYSYFSDKDQKAGKSLGWKNPSGNEISVAEDGTLAAHSHTKHAWAQASKITAANDILKNRKSAIRLEVGSGEVSGKVPGNPSSTQKLKEVKVKSDTGGTAKLTADCGTAAQEAIGIKNNDFAGVTREGGTENYTRASNYRGGHGIKSTTGDMEGDIYKSIMKNEFKKTFTTNLDAMNAFYALSKSEQDRISKKYGINAYARAKVGQGLTIGTDSDAKGFSTRGQDAWNFHFATVILNSKQDDMTIENFAGNAGGNTGWYFVLLGPANKKQDFHYHNGEELGGHGDKYTTFVVENTENVLGKVNTENTHLVGDPAKYDIMGKVPKGSEIKVMRRGTNWMKVHVLTGAMAGKVGWIMNKYYSSK